MPGASLFTFLDDIASVLDDVATLTKVAAKQTAGALSDDLALNAQQVAGVRADRELPVVWKVAKGSIRNKLILVPAALALSSFVPWVVTPLLMMGGAYLCYEGAEKLLQPWLHPGEPRAKAKGLPTVGASSEADLLAVERTKVAGAIRTDFILSAEIVIIALGGFVTLPLPTRIGVLVAVGGLMTVGVYGLVACIVKMDDVGAYLLRAKRGGTVPSGKRALGTLLLNTAPLLMKSLSVVGTIAMFLVGGGLLSHGFAPIGHTLDAWAARLAGIDTVGPTLAWLASQLFNGALGALAGAIVVPVVLGVAGVFRK